MSKEFVDSYEKELCAKHPKPIAAVPMLNGGSAYFRRPTSDEYDEFQMLSQGDEEDEKSTAFARYVKGCFIGAHNGDEPLEWEMLGELEGPAFLVGGACGAAVNKLAGAGVRKTRFL
jgi:hypothetical protein